MGKDENEVENCVQGIRDHSRLFKEIRFSSKTFQVFVFKDVSRISLQGRLKDFPERAQQGNIFSFKDASKICFLLQGRIMDFLSRTLQGNNVFQGSFEDFPSNHHFPDAWPLAWPET